MYWYNNVRCLIYMCDIYYLCIDTIIYPIIGLFRKRATYYWHILSTYWYNNISTGSASSAMAHRCYSHVWRDSFICMKWCAHICHVPHLHTWHIQWHTNAICMCATTRSYVWNDMFMCGYASCTYVTHTMAHPCHSHLWHDRFKCIKRYVHMCNTPQLHMWHMYWHTNAIYMCDMTHSYVWNDMFTCVICLTYICDTCNGTPMPFTCVTWLIHMYEITCSQASCASFTYVTHAMAVNGIHMCNMTHSDV